MITQQITPHESYPELAKSLDLPTETALFFKREDKHPLGSHKGRSIPLMIDKALAEGIREFAISSSGNAALAAAFYIKKLNEMPEHEDEPITLDILIGQKITPNKRDKLDALKDENIRVSSHERPLQMLFSKTQNAAGVETVCGLRQSTDDTALIGYESLAQELASIADLRAVFIGTSSGTTAQALAEYFLKNNPKNPVEVHIVQTSSCHPIAESFNENSVATDDGTNSSAETSIADAIVDHTAQRKTKLIPLIEKTGGSGWIATNAQILTAQKLSKTHAGVEISTNSALSLVGLMNAVFAGKTWKGSVVCLVCGD